MNLTPYLEAVAADLDRATSLADEETRDISRRLVAAVEPGLRLAFTQLLSDAAAQLTAELDSQVVTVHLDGRDPVLVVQSTDAPQAPQPGAEEDASARITLRLSEALKKRAEESAAAGGVSVNTWVVEAIRRATTTDNPTRRPSSRRITGWA